MIEKSHNRKVIMRTFKMDEISGVDRPAQTPAKAVLMKRDEDKPTNKKETTMTEAEIAALQKKAADDAAALEAMTKKAADDAAALVIAKAVSEMTDSHKKHYNTLDEAGKTAFIGKSASDRDAIVTELSKADAIVYTASDGTTFRKSDDERLVAMAKRNDATMAELAKAREAGETAVFAKRAAEELPSYPGGDNVKVALLKAVDGISDEATRKGVAELLKAGNVAMTGAFVKRGTTGGTDQTPAEALHKMANDYATANKVTFGKAYSEVVKTKEGAALYDQTLAS